MGVDKFGRHIVSTGKGVRGPKGEGFVVTNDGHYDIQGKRLCNVLSAKDGSDAVTLKDINNMLDPCVKNVDGTFDFKNTIVTGIADPLNEQDAVNLRVLKRDSISLTGDKHYDIQNKKLCNVLAATNEGDAVNLANVKSLISPCLKEVKGVFNFKNKVVTGLEDPKNDQDAVSLRALKRRALTLTTQGFNAKNMKITNVKAPDTVSDVVTLKYFKDNSIVKDSKNGTFNVDNYRISSVSDPKDNQDVVTFNAFMSILSKFGWVIYEQLHKDKTNKLSFSSWYNIVKLDPYSFKSWNDAFNLVEVKENKIDKDGTPKQTV